MTNAAAKKKILSTGMGEGEADQVVEALEKLASLLPGVSFDSLVLASLALVENPGKQLIALGPDDLVVSRTLLHELELRMQDQERGWKQLLRIPGLLRGPRESSTPVAPLKSSTGRVSKCAELSKLRNKDK